MRELAGGEHPRQLIVHTLACPAVSADADRLRQVLLNLLHNALEASPADQPVRIDCRPLGPDWVEIEIENRGDPIPPKMLERLFEPFVTGKRNGTGLGLAIVRRIVQAHGGDVRLTSTAEDGTRALLRLPTEAGASFE